MVCVVWIPVMLVYWITLALIMAFLDGFNNHMARGAGDLLSFHQGFLVSDNANCSRSFDGVVGARTLGLKWVAFDFEHRCFRWKR